MNYLISKEWGEEYPFYFYKTTNLINGKFYYGSGSKDEYLGSGIAFNNAKEKYGEENFKHERLRFFKTRQCAYDYEDRFLKLFDIKNIVESYNMTNAARGTCGYKHTEETKMIISKTSKERYLDKDYYEKFCKLMKGEKNPFYGKNHSEETKNKISNSNKGKDTNSLSFYINKYGEEEGQKKFDEWNIKKSDSLKGRITSEETKRKMREKKQGVYDGEKNPMYGKKHNEESKRKMREKKQGVYDGEKNPMYGKRGKYSPFSKTYLIEGSYIKSLREVAKKYNISKSTVFKRINSNKYPHWKKVD